MKVALAEGFLGSGKTTLLFLRLESADKMLKEADPEIILAEPLGSCMDMWVSWPYC